MNIRVRSCEIVPSTNDIARDCARAGEAEGLLIVAGAQTAGRGRADHTFFSPAQTGLYMSLLLRPTCPPQSAPLLTVAAAVAVAETAERLTGRALSVKWINDLFFEGKKVCGILAESALAENGALDYVILGIGLNIEPPAGGFPEALDTVAGALFGAHEAPPGMADTLARGIAARFAEHYEHLTDRAFLDAYRSRLFFLGRTVTVITPCGTREGVALDIDRDAHLLVRFPDGETAALSAGEIRIRP